jgi:hypothetical protein
MEGELRTTYFQSLIGRRLTVLIEGQGEIAPGRYAGISCRYAPVEIAADGLQAGSLVGVHTQCVSGCGTRIEAIGRG